MKTLYISACAPTYKYQEITPSMAVTTVSMHYKASNNFLSEKNVT